jgi:hypothetical protein
MSWTVGLSTRTTAYRILPLRWRFSPHQSNEPRTWTSVEELKAFVHGPEHSAYLARRREWFERIDEAIVALWWVEAGHLPTVDEAKDRLALLDRVGPSPAAFTFRTALPAPEAAAGEGQTMV